MPIERADIRPFAGTCLACPNDKVEKIDFVSSREKRLPQLPEDIKVDKYRISGFWDTPLDSILKNLDVHQKYLPPAMKV